MTKDELIQYSTEEVRKTPHLFFEFERIFREENGYGCSACQIKHVLDSWRSQINNKNTNTMSNTFILAKPNALYRVDENTVLSKNSSDEVALQWLSLKTYGGITTKKENLEKIFKKLPKGYGEEVKETEEVDYNSMTVSELKEVAKQLELPEDEYKSLKKSDLVTYLNENANPVIIDDSENTSEKNKA